VERVVEKALAGKWHTLPAELELIGQEIANMSGGWARNVNFRLLRYEEARNQDPRVDSWMLLAENAALSAHGFICEDGPELLKEKGQEAAQEGGETLEGMYTQGCESLEQARIQTVSGALGTEEDEEMRREQVQWLRSLRQGDQEKGMSTQSTQERTPTPVPSDEDDEEMSYDQGRLIRRFKKGGRPSTVLGIGVTKSKVSKG
jgi:hypothetical protein